MLLPNMKMDYVKDFFSFIFEILKIVAIAALIVLPIRYFLFQPFFVRGASMEPNFQNLDYLIIDEISYRLREPERGEVVVFKYPQDPSSRFIKRIIGLPGENIKIEEGKVFIKEEGEFKLLEEPYLPDSTTTTGDMQVFLEKDEYFVLGDNRTFSSDSRRWGSLSRDKIVGRVFLRLLPFSCFAKIEAPQYEPN